MKRAPVEGRAQRDDRLPARRDREIQPRQPPHRRRPGAGRDHDVAGGDVSARGAHRPDPPAVRVDARDRRRLAQLAAELREPSREARRHLVGAAVARAGLPHDRRALGDPEVRADVAHLVGPDQARLDTYFLVHPERALDPVPALRRPHEEHAGAHEAGLPAHLVRPALEDPAGQEGHLGSRARRVVGADDGRGLRRRARADRGLLEQHHPPRAAAGEIEGNAGPHDAAADDDDIRGLHRGLPGRPWCAARAAPGGVPPAMIVECEVEIKRAGTPGRQVGWVRTLLCTGCDVPEQWEKMRPGVGMLRRNGARTLLCTTICRPRDMANERPRDRSSEDGFLSPRPTGQPDRRRKGMMCRSRPQPSQPSHR